MTIHKVVGVVFITFGALLLPLALGALVGGSHTQDYVSSELRSQRISFPRDMSMEPAALRQFAGQTVDTGDKAKAYADMTAGHVAQYTGGKTYAEINAAALKNPNDQTLQQKKRVALEGSVVYNALQNAYGWWQLGAIAKWAALGLTVTGALLGLIGMGQVRQWPTMPQ